MKTQPAKVSYFFGQGYTDLGHTIRDSWRNNIFSARNSFEKSHYVGWIKKIFWWAAGISVVLFGTIWFLALSLLHILILFLFFLIIYFLFTFTWILDYLYRVKEKIFAACPNPGCYEKSSLPIYHCPQCGVAHTQLWPSKYGILNRTCECGQKIPCTFFNGRSKLTATCPHCGGSMNTEEGTPLIIPVVGPPAAGKTTYLYSLIGSLLSSEFSKKGYNVHSNINQRLIDDSIEKLVSGQTLDKTTTENLKAVDLIISKGSMKYAVYFYDYAGESFNASQNLEGHNFYSYFSAMIFILDPFAIEQVRDEYYDRFKAYVNGLPHGRNPYANAMGLDEVVATLTRTLAEHYHIEDKAKIKQSLAVVIPKTDIFTDKVLETDKDCRHFLAKFGQSSFVEQITWKFKNTRFFNAISKGKNSVGVLQPFEWILKREIAKKQIRRFFGNLLMAFFVAVVLGGLALGGFYTYKAITSNYSGQSYYSDDTDNNPLFDKFARYVTKGKNEVDVKCFYEVENDKFVSVTPPVHSGKWYHYEVEP